MKHIVQDLIDAGVITIDSSSQGYKINDHFKVHLVKFPNPPQYSLENPFVIRDTRRHNSKTLGKTMSTLICLQSQIRVSLMLKQQMKEKERETRIMMKKRNTKKKRSWELR